MTIIDGGGRAYREITINGELYLMYAESTKYTIYQEFGAVYIGPPYSFRLPDGRELEGYTNDPALVQQYIEMFNETNAPVDGTDDTDADLEP